MTEKTLNNIERSLGEITGELKGVNQRLDTQNGNVAKCTDRINKLETFKDNLTGKITVIVIVAGTAASLIGFAIKEVYEHFIVG